MSNQLQKSRWGHRLGWCLSVFTLAGGLSLSAQTFQATYSPGQGRTELGASGKGTFGITGEELLLIGTHREVGSNGSVVPVMSLTPNGTILSQFVVKDGFGRGGVELEGVAITDNGEGEYFLGINREERGSREGVVSRVDRNGKVLWSSQWEGSSISDLALHPRTGALMTIGEGIDRLGQPDLRLAIFDLEGKLFASRSLVSGAADRPVAVVPMTQGTGFLVAGIRQERTPTPMLSYITVEGEVEWSFQYQLDRPVVSVDDVAYHAGVGLVAITGSALTQNGDTAAFLMLTDQAGDIRSVDYYGLGARNHSFGLSVTAIEAGGAKQGFVIAGEMLLPDITRYHRSLLLHVGLDGKLNWIRTYGSTDQQALDTDGFTGVSYNSQSGNFAAVGYEKALGNGRLTSFGYKVVQASAEAGLAGDNAGFCADEVEVFPLQGEMIARAVGYTVPRGAAGSRVLKTDGSRWDVSYCSYPLRTRTTTQVVEAGLQGPHRAQVYDMQGRLLHEASVAAGEELRLPTFLPRGVYIVKKSVNGRVVATEKRIQVQP